MPALIFAFSPAPSIMSGIELVFNMHLLEGRKKGGREERKEGSFIKKIIILYPIKVDRLDLSVSSH